MTSLTDLASALVTVHANQLLILSKLKNLENMMSVDFTKLQAEVANNTSVEQSVVALLTQLAAIIKAIPPSNDPATQAQLDQLTQALAANDGALAAAVAANTPAASGS